jgi:hypothetical protein
MAITNKKPNAYKAPQHQHGVEARFARAKGRDEDGGHGKVAAVGFTRGGHQAQRGRRQAGQCQRAANKWHQRGNRHGGHEQEEQPVKARG